MAGLISWFWDRVGLGDPEEDVEEVVTEEESVPQLMQAQPRAAANNVVAMPTKGAVGGTTTRSYAQQGGLNSGAAAQSGNFQVAMFAPHKYDDLPQVVSHLRNGVPVVVSFEGLSDGDTRHMLDFIFGAACALNGTVQRINGNIYMVAPSSVDVTSNMKETLLVRDSLVRSHESRLSVQNGDSSDS